MKNRIIFSLIMFFAFKNMNYAQKNISFSKLWNDMLFKKGVCIGGQQYIKKRKIKKTPLFFGREEWGKFSKNNKKELTYFLIQKLSDTTQTSVHTCPFDSATVGEMAVYALQHVHQKNWYDFKNFQQFKNREITHSTDQPQIWLQKILKNKSERKKLAQLYMKLCE